jgi:hypothetical protein
MFSSAKIYFLNSFSRSIMLFIMQTKAEKTCESGWSEDDWNIRRRNRFDSLGIS